MFGAIISFLGGSAFRLIWEQISSWLSQRQQHAQEIDLMRLQTEIAAAEHQRHLESLRVQAELQVEVVRVQGEAATAQTELEGWASAVAASQRPSGIWLVDLWNGCIRPAAASVAIALWMIALNSQGYRMSDWDRELVGVILGFFFASRVLTKGGR